MALLLYQNSNTHLHKNAPRLPGCAQVRSAVLSCSNQWRPSTGAAACSPARTLWRGPGTDPALAPTGPRARGTCSGSPGGSCRWPDACLSSLEGKGGFRLRNQRTLEDQAFCKVSCHFAADIYRRPISTKENIRICFRTLFITMIQPWLLSMSKEKNNGCSAISSFAENQLKNVFFFHF